MLQVAGRHPLLRGEVRARAQVASLLPAWADLCDRCAEDNVYYAPGYARALLDNLERRELAFALVWEGQTLVALLPFTSSHLPVPGICPAGRAWQDKFIFSCTPLLDASRKNEAAGALVEVLASVSHGEWVIPTVNTQGEACRTLVGALTERALSWSFSQAFQRPALERGESFEQHMQRHVSPSRRKEIARNRRRLEGLGKVEHAGHSSGEQLDAAVAAFLEMEARGWKGRRGTALACEDGTRSFAKGAFGTENGRSCCRADVLSLNGKPIAISLIVVAGSTGFAVKSCYDEEYRSFGVGILLEAEVMRSFLSGNWARRLDSATTGAHVLDSLWPGRIEVADLIFALSPQYAQLRVASLHALERLRKETRETLKRSVAPFRRN
jgi:CelD/BcsL family acetyltransferase involved in cellulose biosynthesis